MTRDERVEWLEVALTESIVILDGGMGTMIQGAGLGERISSSDSKIFRTT